MIRQEAELAVSKMISIPNYIFFHQLNTKTWLFYQISFISYCFDTSWPFSYVLETATPKVPAEKDQPVNKTEKKKKKADKSGTMAESGAQIVNA